MASSCAPRRTRNREPCPTEVKPWRLKSRRSLWRHGCSHSPASSRSSSSSSTHPLAQSNSTFGQGAVRPGERHHAACSSIRQVEPRYTTEAMRAKIAGDIELEAVVNADGTVGDVRVVRSLDDIGTGSTTNAIRAARQWLFTPGHDRDGRRGAGHRHAHPDASRRRRPRRSGTGQGLDDELSRQGTCRVPSEGATAPKLVHQRRAEVHVGRDAGQD